MPDSTNQGVGWDGCIDTIIEFMETIGCDFLRLVYSEEWLVGRFSIRNPDVFVQKEKLTAHIDMLMTPHAIDLGLTFLPFAFPEDAQEADLSHEVPSDIGQG